MSDSLFARGKRQDVQADVISPNAPMFESCPYLYDCLKTTVTADKKIVKGCTLRIGFYLTDVQVCITDEVNKLYAYATLDPFKSLSEALEEVLSSGAINWQDSRGKR